MFPVEAQRTTRRERVKGTLWRPVWHHRPVQTWPRPPTPPKTTQQKPRRVYNDFTYTHLGKYIFTPRGHIVYLLASVSDTALVPNVSIDDLKQMKVGNTLPIFLSVPVVNYIVVMYSWSFTTKRHGPTLFLFSYISHHSAEEKKHTMCHVSDTGGKYWSEWSQTVNSVWADTAACRVIWFSVKFGDKSLHLKHISVSSGWQKTRLKLSMSVKWVEY